MHIYIPTYNRPTTHSTYHVLKKMGIKSTLVFHDQLSLEKYVENGVDAEDCLCLNAKPGLANNRNAILDYVQDEWHIQMSDDALDFQMVHPDYYSHEEIDVKVEPKKWRPLFEEVVKDGKTLMNIFEETKKKAEKEGAFYAGFAITSNHFFRPKKYMTAGLVDGRCILIRKGSLRYDPNVNSIDDSSSR